MAYEPPAPGCPADSHPASGQADPGASDSEPTAPGQPSLRPPVREIGLFTVLALSLAWVVHIPVLLMGEGQGSTAYWITSGFFMLTPGIAAFVVVRYVWRPRNPARATGLLIPRPRIRGVLYCLLAVVLVPLTGTAAALTAGALGLVEVDLTGFSGIRRELGDLVPDAAQPETGLPLIERNITVTGGAVRRPCNLIVPVGTRLRDVIEYCGGLTDDAAAVVIGGPMSEALLRMRIEDILK